MKFLLAIFLFTSSALATELKETDLLPLEDHYANTINLSRPLYRCGEVVRLSHNSAQLALIFNYRFTGKIWLYTVRRAHYSTSVH